MPPTSVSDVTAAALTDVLDALDYSGDSGLLTSDTPPLDDGRASMWQELQDKLQVDAAFFHGNVPVVCFKQLQTASDETLWKLHCSLWNHNRVPLLIVILPQEVRVYNCFATPHRDPTLLTSDNVTLLKQALHQVNDLLTLKRELSLFQRREITSGRFAHAHQRQFDREHRVDSRLLNNLKHIRQRLIDDDISISLANSLLGRAIFVRYLEDREVVDSSYFSRFDIGTNPTFHSLLSRSRPATYRMFDDLAQHFNGDLFPVTDEERSQVTRKHLALLARFLSGDEIATGQMYFWAYDFNFIPIEIISAIYETFLGADRLESSAFYTPPELVDFVLTEVLPFDTSLSDMKILDPACGSGIFLVESYRRLVNLRRRAKGGANLQFEELRDLLTSSIHGVDLSEEAIQVAAFSCYLALLEFLEPKSIWEDVRFPPMKGVNLFVNDFFDEDAPFNDHRYDVIVGNPPWKSSLTSLAADYVERSDYPIGDKQIAQAFLWRAPTLLSDNGQSCLLAPSKGVLFNQSGPNREFRHQFFDDNQVTRVVDFSAFRRSLFRTAVAPTVAIFCDPPTLASDDHSNVTYIGPHPSPLSHGPAGIALYGDDVMRFSPRQLTRNPFIWKMALWGTPRDLTLLDDLRARFPTLGDVAEDRGWLIREGVSVNGSDSHYAPHLANLRFLPVHAVRPFHVQSDQDERLDRQFFHRPGDQRIYKSPHFVIRGGVTKGGFLASAYLSEDAVFKNGLVGVAGPAEDSDHLKIACAFLNSSLARYCYFLTTSTWGIERDVIRLHEYKSIPCALPIRDPSLAERLLSLVNHALAARTG